MASFADDPRVVVSLSRARKALSEHQAWMQQRQSGAFALPGSTFDAKIDEGDDLDVSSFMDKSLSLISPKKPTPNRSVPGRKSGIRVIMPPPSHAPPKKNWKSVLRPKIKPIIEEKETVELKPKHTAAWEDPNESSTKSHTIVEVKPIARKEEKNDVDEEETEQDIANESEHETDPTSLQDDAPSIEYSFDGGPQEKGPLFVRPAKEQTHLKVTHQTLRPEETMRDGADDDVDGGGCDKHSYSQSSLSVVDATGRVLIDPTLSHVKLEKEKSLVVQSSALSPEDDDVATEVRELECPLETDEQSDQDEDQITVEPLQISKPRPPPPLSPLKIKPSLSATSLAELTKTLDVLLSPGGRRSRPPPPYELHHRHSKLAQYSRPCPPYGVNVMKSFLTLSPTPSQSSLATTTTVPDEDESMTTPLHRAARSGDARRLGALIREGADLNARDKNGRTPLMYCLVEKGVHLQCAGLLVRSGCSVNEQDNGGSTALHEAAYTSALPLLQLLLHHRADSRIRDGDGRLAVHWASCHESRRALVALLQISGARGGGGGGGDANATDENGVTPLMLAAYFDRPANVAELLENGADPEEKDNSGRTAMHWAVHKTSAGSLKLLLKHDRTFFKDRKGMTVLHMAAEMGSMPACELILRLRPDSVNDADKEGRTPLHWAAVTSRIDVCAFLLDRGADAAQRDDHGLTALDYARLKKLRYAEALLTCHDKALAEYAKSRSMQSYLYASKTSSLASSVVSVQSANDDDDVGDDESTMMTMLVHGSWLGKFTHDCKGPVVDRFFFLDMVTGKVCWTKRPLDRHRATLVNTMHLIEVHPGPSEELRRRVDFSPNGRDKYAFHVTGVGDDRLDLLAHSDALYSTWMNGLERFLLFGAVGISSNLTAEKEAWANDNSMALPFPDQSSAKETSFRTKNKVVPVS